MNRASNLMTRGALLLAALLLSTSSLAASALEARVDGALERMTHAEGAAYLDAREELRALGEAALPHVQARFEKAASTPTLWREAAVLEAAVGWLSHPKEMSAAYELEGVQPSTYLHARIAKPMAVRELSRLGVGAPALLEVVLKGEAIYPFAAATAYPTSMPADERTRLRALEQEAVVAGAVKALGGARLRSAPSVLRDVVRNGKSTALRQTAAMALGQTRDVDAVQDLTAIATDAAQPLALREAATVGLGMHRTKASGAALLVLARNDATVQGAALRALTTWASPWAWDARGASDEGAALRKELHAQVAALSTSNADATQARERALAALSR
jgi:hypothetical protein